MSNKNAPFHPIIYVRGYAMTPAEIDETTADPFCGFNLGSTVFRATPEKERHPRKFIFESPVVRLNTDYGYKDVYNNGLDIMDDGWSESLPSRSIIIYRYYEQASHLLGNGKTRSIPEFARGLGELIIKVRDLVCKEPENEIDPDEFRCYLVAHSMGGLVCRTLLQNKSCDPSDARTYIDKVFTYATPHNGIDMAGINVPEWLKLDDINNFNRDNMSDFLALKPIFKKTKRVDWLPEESFPSERFFSLVGTNRSDYKVAHGLSRVFTGHGSDGLVRIENASVWGVDHNGRFTAPSATAYVYRSHSGYFGIVNSEESYQNLTRFLFGDVRADIWLDIDDIRLPGNLQKESNSGKSIDALYQFELLASPRGKMWYLTRRISEEDSVACLSHQQWEKSDKETSIYLSTLFLSNKARVNPGKPSLSYAMKLGVRVPDYEIDRLLWKDEHYEGGYLFNDTLIIELVPPMNKPESNPVWDVKFDWRSDNHGPASKPLSATALEEGKVILSIPFGNDHVPGINGKVRFVVSEWNNNPQKAIRTPEDT